MLGRKRLKCIELQRWSWAVGTADWWHCEMSISYQETAMQRRYHSRFICSTTMCIYSRDEVRFHSRVIPTNEASTTAGQYQIKKRKNKKKKKKVVCSERRVQCNVISESYWRRPIFQEDRERYSLYVLLMRPAYWKMFVKDWIKKPKPKQTNKQQKPHKQTKNKQKMKRKGCSKRVVAVRYVGEINNLLYHRLMRALWW